MGEFSYSHRRRVKYIASDTPSPGTYANLRGALPLLECFALGPLHLAIAADRSKWKYKSELSISLRNVLSKFTTLENGEAAVGRLNNGEPLDSTSSGEKYRTGAVSQTKCAEKARKWLRRFTARRR